MGGSHGVGEVAAQRLRQLEAIARAAPAYIVQLGCDGVVLYLNRDAPGQTPAGFVGQAFEQVVAEASRPAFRAALRRVIESGQADGFEGTGATTGRYFVARLSPIVEHGRVSSVVLVSHDLTERKALEDELGRSEARFRALVEASFHALAVSIDGTIVECNEALARLTGQPRAALIGTSPATMCAPASAAEIAARIRAGDERPYEIELFHRDGRSVPVEVMARNLEWDGRPARVVDFRDLTAQRQAELERRRLEQQMHQAQRLETLGVLVSGIAHDFNNLLQVVQVEADVLARGPAAADLPQVASHIRLATRRAADLTHQMLAYGGQLPARVETLVLADLVAEMAELLRVSVTRTAELVVALEPAAGAVEGDASQLRQVILNLVVNASEALPATGGRVAIGLRRGALAAATRARAVLDAAGAAHEFVTLEVRDTGAGIEPAIQARIFDPFYSTKFQGRGLGLASVLGIVRSHRGVLEVDSRPGHGTCMRVHLPASTGRPAAAPAPTRARAPAPALRGKGLVLIADDEPAIRGVVSQIVELAGFTVITATTGRAALAAIAAHGDALRAALVDLTMPEVTGDVVVATARAARPELLLILMSGHLDGGGARCPPGVHFLAKPFAIGELEALLATIG